MTSNVGLGTFRRGVHPHEGKELAEGCGVTILPPPAELCIPMSQHIGAPCVPLVKMRETVEYGQKIGAAEAFVSAPVFASLPGTVKRLGMTTLANGRRVQAITLTTNVEAFSSEVLFQQFCARPKYDLSALDVGEIFTKIKDSGLVGQGGATFPTHVKLAKNEKKPIDTLLVNGCECEPYLTADYRSMLEMTGCVVAGAQLAAKAVGATRVVYCVEDNKPAAIAALREAVAAEPKNGMELSVAVLQTKYPQGGEKQLIFATLGRTVPLGALPMDVGAAVMNVGTAISIAQAVLYNAPLTHRVVTVTGGGIARPGNFFVPIGTSVRTLIDFCGGLRDNAQRVISGGPMMGFALGTLDTPVTKGTSGITVLTDEEVKNSVETNCVRCGRCVVACPMGLVPTRLAMAARSGQWELMTKYHPMACVECGCCAFGCPAGLPLVQWIRVGKSELNRQKSKK